MMYHTLEKSIRALHPIVIPSDRKLLLQSLIDYIQEKVDQDQSINLNFICTHNSRRSHLAQIWAHVAANYYHVREVNCYSGGTEATALFPAIKNTLTAQGLEFYHLTNSDNPIYAIKYSEVSMPIIAFSKKYDHPINPKNKFAAIMTCSHADENCPFITGKEKRIAITYEDPKVSDGTPDQEKIYLERSQQIAREMLYVMSEIKSKK